MTVVSKFFQKTKLTLENVNYPSGSFAKILLATAVSGYIIRVSYPYLIQKRTKHENSQNSNHFENKERIESESYIKNEKETEEDTIIKAEIIIAKQNISSIPGLNKEFINNLVKLMSIMVPSLVCRETAILCVHTLFLLTRTFLSIYVAGMEGAIVKYIVQKDFKKFSIMLMKWFGIAVPATFINSMIRYLENKLALAFRYVNYIIIT